MEKKAQVERKSLSGQVAEALREMIFAGEFAQGEQLRQDEMAKRLGVSRIPVREAFHQLEAEGLVVNVPYKGAVVTKLSEEEITEQYDIRAVLEVDLLRRGIANIDEKAVKQARAALKKMQNASAKRWGDLNWQLHSALLECANRPITLELIKRIHDNLDRYVRIELAISQENRDRAHREHEALIDMCEAGKAEEACKVLQGHLLGARDDLLRELKGAF